MREIKFRAWDNYFKIMLNVKNINFEFKIATVIPKKSVNKLNIYETSLEELVIMQYTGLLDKSGKEVYEGDIIYSKKYNVYSEKVVEERGEVCFVNGSFTVNTKLLTDLCNTEVIGNIYENPTYQVIEEETEKDIK